MALGMVFAACNDDYKKDYDPKPDPADKIGAPVASIAEGATVDAEATKVITLTYEKPVALNPRRAHPAQRRRRKGRRERGKPL